MEFITSLPTLEGKDGIFVIIYQLIEYMNLLCPYQTAFKKPLFHQTKLYFIFDEMFEFHIANLKN